MRILHLVSSATLTGPADPALSLARMQKELLGHDVALAYDTMRPGNLADKGRGIVTLIDELALNTKGGLALAIRDRKRLQRIAKSFDLVHAHSSHDHALAALAGVRPLFRSIHHPRSAERRGAQWVAYRKTDGFFVVAEAHREKLLESYPSISSERVFVVPGGVDLERFSPRSGSEFRAAEGVPVDAFVIGMVARFQEGRRQEDLIDAFAIVRGKSPRPVHLVFIGKGETQRAIEAHLETRGVRASTTLYGFRDADLPDAIASLDLSVLLKEGNDASCRAVLESLAAGVPVVGARYPAIEDALAGSGAGWIVEPGNVAALSDAILKALQRTGPEFLEMRRLARARAEVSCDERRRAALVDTAYRRTHGRD
ncbi:MAG: glycosyltransferase family 4 protein [Deltaproteobacteria bacterium]|nr:glycosyltransferase family 4 protein [Deltaproteobacteria bacterium]